MKAARILQFGPPSAIVIEDIPCPEPSSGELLIRVKAAGVGPWDALVREGHSAIHQPLPLVLGSDLSGIVEKVGPDISEFQFGDEVYGVTNKQFTGAYAEYALASAKMTAHKPKSLSFVEAASAPVVAVTAWQMLFDYAHVEAGHTVLVQGAAGNVGAYAVQMASHAGVHVVGTASTRDVEYVHALAPVRVLDYQNVRFEDSMSRVDAVIDTVGGSTLDRSMSVLKPDGILVSSVAPIPDSLKHRFGERAIFFLVEVTTARLNKITELFDSRKLAPQVGTVLPLEKVRTAHEMLAGAPHNRGKIVLEIA